MAKLTTDDVLHIAKLAKLKLTGEEVVKFQKQLSSIVDFVDNLKNVDVEGIEPTSQTTGLTNSLRSDEVSSFQSLSQDEALSGSENTHNGYFKVGAILTERSDK